MRSLKVVKGAANAAEIYFYGEVGWEITAQMVADEFKQLEAEKVNLYINSPGGDVFEGIAIYNIIQRSQVNVTAYIDGLAASAASFVALAADDVLIAEHAQMMIHNPWAGAIGESKDLQKTKDLLDELKQQMIAIYSKKTGLPEAQVAQMMDDETWMNAEKAVELGFADSKYNGLAAAASAGVKHDFSKFHYLNKPDIKPPKNQKEGVKMKKLYALFGVETEEEVIKKAKALVDKNDQLAGEIKQMQEEQEVLQSKIADFQAKELEAKVDEAVKAKKLLPAQKDWAIALAKKDSKLLDSYLETAKPHNIDENEEVDEGSGEITRFEDLREDLELREKVQKENPELYNKLRIDWLNRMAKKDEGDK
jgi:ATP-dependent Clp endopeptidase proteolytic subunit ClpP